jgi:hypothetical protein
MEASRRQERSKLTIVWEDKMKLPRFVKVAIAWIACWLMFALFALITVTFAVTFGEVRFNAIITSWGISLGQTFGAEEPIMIWIYLFLPWLLSAASQNELASELVNAFLATGVGSCVGKCFGMCSG